jgi:hypothetical protein
VNDKPSPVTARALFIRDNFETWVELRRPYVADPGPQEFKTGCPVFLISED